MAEQPASSERAAIGHKNEKVGQVVSAKMEKTIVVEVTRRVPHPVYKRIVSKRKKFYAHDEERTARVGDVVRIIECRPCARRRKGQKRRLTPHHLLLKVRLPRLGLPHLRN